MDTKDNRFYREKENIFKPDWSKPRKISLWERIRLYFKPIQMSYDLGSEDTTVIWYKNDKGKIYILDINNNPKN